jgi:hypothetical protein
MKFKDERLKTFSELFDLYTGVFAKTDKQWIFRGVPDACYQLETTLERARRQFAKEWTELSKIEKRNIRLFRRQAHLYLENPPKDDDTIEWLALMQHFGAPTRLLDWTYSFFVALFFAVEKAEKECAVWAIDMNWLTKEARKLFPPGAEKYGREDPPYKSGKFFRHVFCGPPTPRPLVFTLNPERLNQRLIVQQGLFIAPADIGKPFAENLDNIQDIEPNEQNHGWKIIIDDDVELRREILSHLHRMNINRASLFPGLSGFAESLVTYVANPELLGKSRS